MENFQIYFNLGYEHILDIQGFDHILFVLTLSAVYYIKEWKKVLGLVTAFTLGHSMTLALAAFDIVLINPDLIELLIPITIAITALYNIVFYGYKQSFIYLYLLVLGFGLIHGFGFSNYFRELMMDSQEVLAPLLSFNIGVELGQVLVVICALILNYLGRNFLKITQRDWNLVVSGMTLGVAIVLIIEKLS